MIGSIRLRALMIGGLIACASTCAVLAATVQIPCSRDNTLIESATGEWSGGTMPWIFAGQTKQNEGERKRRAVLRFELNGPIPLGSTINSATLRLHVNKSMWAGTNAYTLHKVLADWQEGTSGGFGGSGEPTQPGSSTWIHRNSPGVLWSTPGGDFVSSASATTSVSGIANYNWTSAQLAADVQAWLNAPSTNFGWLLRGNEASVPTTTSTSKRFDSREGPANVQPLLTIDYTPPASFGACCTGQSCVQASPAACTSLQGIYRGDGVACEASTCATSACPADINHDSVVNVSDLLTVITNWGPCPTPPAPCPADIAVNGAVDVADLLTVITFWGPCPT